MLCFVQKTKPAGDSDLFAVNIVRKKTFIHYCTGALIAENAVLLPASCIAGKEKVPPEAHPLVRVGTLDIDEDQAGLQIRTTANSTIHPGFDGSAADGYSNDVAILFLNESISNPKLIELATAPCEEMESLGWFKPGPPNSCGAPVKQLERAELLTRHDKEDCENSIPGKRLREGMFCVCGPPKAFNEWDHGALLVCPGNPGTLIGVASCRTNLITDRTAYVYTDLLQFSGWIQKQLESFGSSMEAVEEPTTETAQGHNQEAVKEPAPEDNPKEEL